MKNQLHARIVGILSITHLLILLSAIVFTKTVNVSLGVFDRKDLDNPDLMLTIIHEHPIILFYPSVDIFMGLTLIGISMGFWNIFKRSNYLGPLQAVFGVSAGIFYIYGSFSRLLTLPHFADVYTADPGAARLSYNIVNFLQYGNSYFINVLFAFWVIISCVLFYRRKLYSKYLCFGFILLSFVSLFIVAWESLFPVLFPLLIFWYLMLAFFKGKNRHAQEGS